jgi:hypothetical protein
MSKAKRSETTIQIMLVQRVQWFLPEYAPLIFHIPNGGKRDKKTAMVLKRMGVRAGVPDLFIAVPRDGYHGCFVEVKREGGVISGAQTDTVLALATQGYRVEVSEGLEATWSVILDYLGVKNG